MNLFLTLYFALLAQNSQCPLNKEYKPVVELEPTPAQYNAWFPLPTNMPARQFATPLSQ